MFTTLLTVALFASPAIRGVLAADFNIQTPSFVQCQESKITWDDVNGPYNLIIVPESDVCADPIADLGDHSSNHITYKVALPANQKVVLSLVNSAGAEAWSGAVTVGASDDSSCVPEALLKAASKAASSSSAVPSSSSAAVSSSSTVVAGNTLTVSASSTTAKASGSAVAIGAANAGTNPFGGSEDNGASAHAVATPLIAFSAMIGAVLLAL